MKITHVESWQVVVPCRRGVLEQTGRWFDPERDGQPYDTAEVPMTPRGPVAALPVHNGMLFDQIPKWIVRVHTDDGPVGVGESSRGEVPEAIECGIKALIGKDPRQFALHELPLP